MAETTETPKRRGWLKWALALSLALNLLVVGLVAGAAIRFGGKDGGPRSFGPPVHSYGVPFVRALPREDQRALGRKLRSESSGLPSRAERGAMYRRMVALLRQDPFDAEEVRAMFAAQADVAQRVQGAAQEGWLSIVSDMSAEERADVADRLEQAMMRRKDRDGKPRD